jgi:hypothetical protein
MGTEEGNIHKIINFYLYYNDLFPCRDRRTLIPLPSPWKVDESSFYISPHELNANSISGIKTFKSSRHFSFHRRVEEANPGSFF